MEIKIIKEKINKEELERIAKEFFAEMVKAVVDVNKEIIAVGGELHADANSLLVENDSRQENLWGINIYLKKPKNERIEFSALINIRPTQNNRSMEIQDNKIKEKIREIVDKLIE